MLFFTVYAWQDNMNRQEIKVHLRHFNIRNSCGIPHISLNFITLYQMWRRGVVVITTAKLHSAKPELRFCAGSNPARSVSEIRDDEDL